MKQGPLVELVVPTLNEAHALEQSVETIRRYLRNEFPYPARVLVADNGSQDGTGDIGDRLAKKYEDVRCLRLNQRGRGLALREAWAQSEAGIVAYTDVDISTELSALEKICRAMNEEGFDLGSGSRLLPESQVTRGAKRELISRAYNLFVKLVLGTKFSDAQCGLKAASREVVEKIVPQIEDNDWFFDTELLVLSEKQGFRIADVPVKWVDDSDSRVKIIPTAWDDIKGVMRIRRFLWSRSFKENRVAPSREAQLST